MYCAANLATFLPKLFEKPQRPNKDYKTPRIGIVVKGCDGRSVLGLVKEKQVPRENIVIIGMPCTGMVPASKNEKSSSEEIARACVECVSPTIKGIDIVIDGESRKPARADYARIRNLNQSLQKNGGSSCRRDLKMHQVQRVPGSVPELLLQGVLCRSEETRVGFAGKRAVRNRGLSPGQDVSPGRPLTSNATHASTPVPWE